MKKYIISKYGFVFLIVAFSSQLYAQELQDKSPFILDFDIVKIDNKLNINWVAINSSITNYFEIERSKDGNDFKTIAYVFGPDPKKDCDCYLYSEKLTNRDIHSFYRLKQVGINGEINFSETRKLKLSTY